MRLSYRRSGQAATVFTLTTNFSYDGDGRRLVVEVEGHATTTATVDYAAGGHVLAEETVTGTTLYLYGRDCLGQFAGGEWLYYLSDAAGHVRQGVDETEEVVSAWLLDPDGTVVEGPEGLVSHLICGGVYDWSTGLIYRDGRYFDPLLGIWLALVPLFVVEWGRRRKKKRRGVPWVMVLLFVVGGGVLVGCAPGGTGTPGSPLPTPTVCLDSDLTPTLPPTFTPTPLPSPTPTPIPDEIILLVPYHSQTTETALANACGPASLLMVLQYWERESSLERVIDHLRNIPPEEGGYDPSCSANPVCTSPGALAKVAQSYGLRVNAHDGWTLGDVRESLISDRPVIADVILTLQGGRQTGHFVVIYGISINEQKIYYHDPYIGADREAVWDGFASSCAGPVDQGDPLQPGGHEYWGMAAYP